MSGFKLPAREVEEKIAVQPEYFFIVDCPSLHLVPVGYLEARRNQVSEGLWEFDRAFCPQCRQVIRKTRQIPSACFSVDDTANRSVTNLASTLTLTQLPLVSSPIPTPVPSPGIGVKHGTRRFGDGRTDSIFSIPSNSSASPPPRWTAPLTVIEDVPAPVFRPYSPDLPEVVPSQEKQLDENPSQNRASVNPGKPSKLGQLFKRSTAPKEKAEKPVKPEKPRGSSKSITSHESIGNMLPKFMSFCFSATGKNLLLWKKESEMLVRIELETFGGRAIDLGDMLPQSDGQRVVHIRHVVEGNDVIAVILSHNHDIMLLVLHSSGLKTHASLRQLEAAQLPTCLAISPDNSYVAVGMGPRVVLLQYSGFELQWGITLQVPNFTNAQSVKFQTCNFAHDSSSIIVSTQRNDPRRSQEDDMVYTYVWACQPTPGNPKRLWSCKMPTDGQGLTTVQYLPSFAMGFITGLTSTRYYLFLSSASLPLPETSSKVHEYRIRCSCVCPPPNTHILYFMDVLNKIFKVDMRTLRIEQFADVNTSRGALKPAEEHAILAATAEGRLNIFWRQGPGLWSLEVRQGSSKAKTNLRGVWHDAIGG